MSNPTRFLPGLSLLTVMLTLAAANVLSDENEYPVGGGEEKILEEVIVTALKRGDQNLVDTAAGIAVITGEDIENMGASSLTDFLQLAPGISIDSRQAGTVSIQIRGVNSTSSGASSVAFYMDDLAFSLININITPDPSPYDLESVEVLKGPQGTLYGAGASGGVVLIRTKDPVLDQFSGKFDLSGSDTDGASGGANSSASAAINFPLMEGKVAARGVVSYQNKAGWINDTFDPSSTGLNDEESLSARLKILAEPTDNLSFLLSGGYRSVEHGIGLDAADDSGELAISGTGYTPPHSDLEYTQFGLVVNYDFDSFSLRNATSYIDFEIDSIALASGFPSILAVDSWVNEFRINSTTDRPFSWVAGVYYRDSGQFLDTGFVNDDVSSEQYSLFVDGTLELLDGALELSAGLSYFEDKTTAEYDATQALALRAETAAFFTVLVMIPPEYCPAPGLCFGISDPATAAALADTLATVAFGFPADTVLDPVKVETNRTSPQATIAYHPTDDTTVYFRYAEGFRAATTDVGALRISSQASTGVLDPEDITSFELGLKGTFFDGAVYAEAMLFYNDLENTQQIATMELPGIGARSVNLSAGDARTRGVDWLISANPIDGLNLSFSGSYVDAEFTEDFYIPGAPETEATLLFKKGGTMNLVPEWTLGGTASYFWDLGIAGLQASSFATIQYASERTLLHLHNVNPDPEPGDKITRVDLRFEVGRDKWSVYFFANNINNEDGRVFEAITNELAAYQPIDGMSAVRLRPRTLGLGFRYNF